MSHLLTPHGTHYHPPKPWHEARTLSKWVKSNPTMLDTVGFITDKDGTPFKVFPMVKCSEGDLPENLTAAEASRRCVRELLGSNKVVFNPTPSVWPKVCDIPYERWWNLWHDDWWDDMPYVISRRDGSEGTRFKTYHAAEFAFNNLKEPHWSPMVESMQKHSKSKTVVLVMGYARCGKDTTTLSILKQAETARIPTKKLAFASPIREEFLAALINLLHRAGVTHLDSHARSLVYTDDTKVKDEQVRPGLVSLGTGCARALVPDIFLRIGAQQIVGATSTDLFVVSDCRFGNEATEFMNLLPKGVKVVRIWVERPGIGPANSDEAKYTTPLKELADVVLKNDGTLEELDEKITTIFASHFFS